jgi:hypothetical protein
MPLAKLAASAAASRSGPCAKAAGSSQPDLGDICQPDLGDICEGTVRHTRKT